MTVVGQLRARLLGTKLLERASSEQQPLQRTVVPAHGLGQLEDSGKGSVRLLEKHGTGIPV